MLARATAATPHGIDACPVAIEVDAHYGLPQMQIVGLPDAAIKESRERVRAAIKNCGFELPPRNIVVNLAPADLRKEGNHLDLAIALALLAALGHLPQRALAGRLLCGELGLDGAIRSVRGGLAIAELGKRLAIDELLLPELAASQAAVLGGPPAVAPSTLLAAVDHLTGRDPLPPALPATAREDGPAAPDLADVRGLPAARRALEVAAAGGHNLLFVGPPGCGKTMLARRLPGLLPPLTLEEAIAVTKIHTLVAPHGGGDPRTGRAKDGAGLVRRRPFRSPHPGVSAAGLLGGGTVPRPGEASLAHLGVLFLDELPEFRRDALEGLRQPLEEGRVTVVRARGSFTFPSRFALLAAMNPCPCGHLGDPRLECRCTPPMIERYRSRVSGPLLDRIDLHLEVPAPTLDELKGPPGEATAEVARRVAGARLRQRRRFGLPIDPGDDPTTGPAPAGAGRGSGGDAAALNATLTSAEVRRLVTPDAAGQQLLDSAFEQLGLSARALERILKVALTLADLAGKEKVGAGEIAEAIQYRALDRRLES